jgi:hypothetical protein
MWVLCGCCVGAVRVLCGCMWVHVGACGCMWVHVGALWVHVDACLPCVIPAPSPPLRTRPTALVRAFNCLSEAGLAMDTARLWGWLLAHRNHHSGVAETHPGLGELGGVSEVVAAEAHSPEWDRVVAAGIRGWVSLVLVPCVSLPLVLRPVDDGGSLYLHRLA